MYNNNNNKAKMDETHQNSKLSGVRDEKINHIIRECSKFVYD